MTKRLIIDSKLAILNQGRIFDQNWSWPIDHNQYDEPFSEFVKWSDELHKQLKGIPGLINAFFLIKSDLLKDLSYYASAWIDVAKAKQEDTQLIYGPDEHIFESLLTDSFTGQPPTVRKRNVGAIGLTGGIRSKLSRFKRSWINHKALSDRESCYFATTMNDLGKQISPQEISFIRFQADDFKRTSSDKANLPKHLDELARQISDFLCAVISKYNTPPSSAFSEYMYYIAFYYLTRGWSDSAINPMLEKIKTPATLITGTGSGYSARVLSYQFLLSGNEVLRTTHGGDAPFFNDALSPSIEFPFASKYIVYGDQAAQTIKTTIDNRTESEYPFYTRSVVAAGSNFHSKILNRAQIKKNKEVHAVTIVAGCFLGTYRGAPQPFLHDVVYMEWQRRLLLLTKKLGYKVTSKRHPKGRMSRTKIFPDSADNELINTTMADIEQHTDAYIFDFQGTAFMEAICTLKPVIYIDIPIRPLRFEARSQISESISIVPAFFNQQNRVVIDEKKLEQALIKPVDINARERLIHDYLLRPSLNYDLLRT